MIAARRGKTRGNEGKKTPGDGCQGILSLSGQNEEKQDSSTCLHLPLPPVIGQSGPSGKYLQKQLFLFLPLQICPHFLMLMQTVYLMCREDLTQEERFKPKFLSNILRSSLAPLHSPPPAPTGSVPKWLGDLGGLGLGTRWSCPLKLIR